MEHRKLNKKEQRKLESYQLKKVLVPFDKKNTSITKQFKEQYPSLKSVNKHPLM